MRTMSTVCTATPYPHRSLSRTKILAHKRAQKSGPASVPHPLAHQSLSVAETRTSISPWTSDTFQLVGGQFDLEMNFIIQEGDSIICMVELLDKCDVTCQAEIWSIFTAILKKSIRNLLICTEVGLVELVLNRIDKVDGMIADLLVDMLGVLASYSITVRELKLFFSKLQGEKGHWINHTLMLSSV
ncbi:unnamed protein product [Ranitomeya imitator]|uniref:Neurobeachin alpha-solenoid region domain-containing protein n=1 Tax=Ranitomeya imitator TaxID=111125 RepID=A0ABN9KW86_9NEOB|nr:unnamed protein product [Ranitomeya imitator]